MSTSDAFYQQKVRSAPIFCCHILNLVALFLLIVPAIVLYPYAIRKRRVVCTVTNVVAAQEIMDLVGHQIGTPARFFIPHAAEDILLPPVPHPNILPSLHPFTSIVSSQNGTKHQEYPVFVQVEWEESLHTKGKGNLLRCAADMKYQEKMVRCFKQMQQEFRSGRKLDCAVPCQRRNVIPWKKKEQRKMQWEADNASIGQQEALAVMENHQSESSLPLSNPQVHEYDEWLTARRSISLSLLKLAGIVAGVCICIDLIFMVTCFSGDLVKTYIFRNNCCTRHFVRRHKGRAFDEAQRAAWSTSNYTIEYETSDVCTYCATDPVKRHLCDTSKPKVRLNLQVKHILANTASSLHEKIVHEQRIDLYDALKTSGAHKVWWRMTGAIIILLGILLGAIGMIIYLAVYYELWSIVFVLPVCIVLNFMVSVYFVDVCIIPFKNTVVWVTNSHRVIVHSSGMVNIFNLEAVQHIYSRDELLHETPPVLDKMPKKYHSQCIVERTDEGDDVLICSGVRDYGQWQRLYRAIQAQSRIARYHLAHRHQPKGSPSTSEGLYYSSNSDEMYRVMTHHVDV